jgi:hypothetical protein
MLVECEDIRAFLRYILTRQGFATVEAADELTPPPDGIDLIITNRPGRLVPFDIPILYIAAVPEPDLARRCAGVLPKPFTWSALLDAVEACIPPRRASIHEDDAVSPGENEQIKRAG